MGNRPDWALGMGLGDAGGGTVSNVLGTRDQKMDLLGLAEALGINVRDGEVTNGILRLAVGGSPAMHTRAKYEALTNPRTGTVEGDHHPSQRLSTPRSSNHEQ
jgi:hypothetical protein